MTWYDALSGCDNLTFPAIPDEEYVDWRLPNIKELLSLIDYGQSNPALPSSHFFQNVQPAYYWSGTTFDNDTDKAWAVNINNGSVSLGDKTLDSFNVWPVRGGL